MSNGGIPLALRISGLTKSFPGFQLGPFDLDLEPGRVLGFVGPNGAGKTTTFNCVAGLLRPDAGDIELLGRPSTPGDARWRDDLGHVGEVELHGRVGADHREVACLSGVVSVLGQHLAALGRLLGGVLEDRVCLLYTSDAADDLLCVDLGGRRIINKTKTQHTPHHDTSLNPHSLLPYPS